MTDDFDHDDVVDPADDDELDAELSWRRPSGIFVLAELQGALRERVHEIQRTYDPKLAASGAPHVTLIGSSGAGPIAGTTPVRELRAALEPIAATTPPLALTAGAPQQFMQTEIVVLPLDPHGPLRTLHERILASGLRFGPVRFAFTPHVTLNFYATLTAATRRALHAVRLEQPLVLDRIQCSLTRDPLPPVKLLELPFTGP